MWALDRHLFEWINGEATNYFFDLILPLMRDGRVWIPLYVILLVYAVYTYRKKVWIFILPLILTVSLTDSMSHHLIKKSIERPRPCHAEANVDVRLLVSCGSGYSFTSNHATNHMGLAIFISLTLFSANSWALILFLAWAIMIGYAQIYVGVHYPSDILGGFILGSLIASLGIFIYRRLKQSWG
jgi:undecaprenyl-diphosphatase